MTPSADDANFRERFTADHIEIEERLQAILAFEAEVRERLSSLWGQLETRLLTHLAAEEKHLIPELLRANERAARAILEEHRHIRARCTEVGAGMGVHVVHLETARAFIDELRAHARHEDEALYEWADAR